MNLALAEKLENCRSVYLLDGQRWMNENSYSPKLWYLTKLISPGGLSRAAGDLKAAISAILGTSRKLLVVDLDNILWGGAVGDVGWEGIRLRRSSLPGGSLFRVFPEGIEGLRNRGILLAIWPGKN